MDFSVARAFFRRNLLSSFPRVPTLRRITILRENYHSRVVQYELCDVETRVNEHHVMETNAKTYTKKETNERSDKLSLGYRYQLNQCQIVNDYPTLKRVDLLETLKTALRTTRIGNTTATIEPTTCFDFWQTEAWWINRVPDYWFKHPYRSNQRRVVHLLNQLTRVLRQLYRLDVASALKVLRALSPLQIDLINNVFVEPINGSLIASHLSTIFMHNKQQTGLNMKHEANKQFHLEMKCLQSEREFDPKIYLKMCTSCVKRDIFEIMVRVRLSAHANRADRETRNSFIFCLCDVCDKLRQLANAWRYYDCDDYVWIRLEFPRKVYSSVCELLLCNHNDGDMQLVFTSDKNEFNDERLFVDNFINYYTFYENGQHPLVIDQCTTSMRNVVSVLYIFATINWVMLVESRRLNQSNSISMNQQSLCKSRNNPLYSAFSENCINRVRAEKVRRFIRENAAYVDRGLGIVSNTGVNAFNVSHELRLVSTTPPSLNISLDENVEKK